jgi:uncharacterized protein YueI
MRKKLLTKIQHRYDLELKIEIISSLKYLLNIYLVLHLDNIKVENTQLVIPVYKQNQYEDQTNVKQ